MATVLRRLFDIPDDIHYLNCAYMAPMPLSVRLVGEQAIAKKLRPWLIQPHDFFEDAEATRELLGSLLGCDSNCIAFGPSASYGLALAAQNIPVTSGQNIVLVDEEFPSNVYVWQEVCQRSNATLRIVRPQPPSSWNEAVIAAIDGNTALVSVPHCHWSNGYLFDLPNIAKVAGQNGAALVIDATQSLGAAQLDLFQIKPDFVVASAYKWLLGPYAMAVYYVAEKYHSGRPIEFNWLNRKDSDQFANLINYEPEYQSGARRFDVGHRGSFSLLPMLREGLNLLSDWGVARVSSELAEKTSIIANECRTLGLATLEDKDRANHILGVGLPGDEIAAKAALQYLARKRIFVSQRGKWLRISPHLYNDRVDIEALIEGFKRFLTGSDR